MKNRINSGLILLCLVAATASADDSATVAAGRRLAYDFDKGNCLACHSMPTDSKASTMANIGPPLRDMRMRFPDRSALKAQIWDPTARNPNADMPPFGKHRILTDEEIDLIIDYLYTL